MNTERAKHPDLASLLVFFCSRNGETTSDRDTALFACETAIAQPERVLKHLIAMNYILLVRPYFGKDGLHYENVIVTRKGLSRYEYFQTQRTARNEAAPVTEQQQT